MSSIIASALPSNSVCEYSPFRIANKNFLSCVICIIRVQRLCLAIAKSYPWERLTSDSFGSQSRRSSPLITCVAFNSNRNTMYHFLHNANRCSSYAADCIYIYSYGSEFGIRSMRQGDRVLPLSFGLSASKSLTCSFFKFVIPCDRYQSLFYHLCNLPPYTLYPVISLIYFSKVFFVKNRLLLARSSMKSSFSCTTTLDSFVRSWGVVRHNECKGEEWHPLTQIWYAHETMFLGFVCRLQAIIHKRNPPHAMYSRAQKYQHSSLERGGVIYNISLCKRKGQHSFFLM